MIRWTHAINIIHVMVTYVTYGHYLIWLGPGLALCMRMRRAHVLTTGGRGSNLPVFGPWPCFTKPQRMSLRHPAESCGTQTADHHRGVLKFLLAFGSLIPVAQRQNLRLLVFLRLAECCIFTLRLCDTVQLSTPKRNNNM